MADALKIVILRKKLEGLKVEPKILRNYLKNQQRQLLNRARVQVEKENKISEESLKAYFAAADLAESRKEKLEIVNQIIFYIRLLETKTPKEVLENYDWITSDFESIHREISDLLEKDELIRLENLFKTLDNEKNLLKKDFNKLRALLDEIGKFSLLKYGSAEKRLEREESASQRLKELTEKLENLLSNQGKSLREDFWLESIPEETDISKLIAEESEIIVALAPHYHRQVSEYLREFIENSVKGKSEIEICRFENLNDQLRKSIYTEFIEFLNKSDLKSMDENNISSDSQEPISEDEKKINVLQQKIQKISEVMEIFKEDYYLEEIKKSAHAWFQTARINFAQIKVGYLKNSQSGKPLKGLFGKIRRFTEKVENSNQIFGELCEKFKVSTSEADLLLLEDKNFLENLMVELQEFLQSIEKENAKEIKFKAPNIVEEQTIFSRFLKFFSVSAWRKK